MKRLILLVLALNLLTLGCGDDDPTPPDATPDALVGDADPGDADPGDADPGDADPGDADPGDADLGDGDAGRNTRCDEGPITCPATEPSCGAEEIAAIRGGCWECVNAITCAPWGTPGCETDRNCVAREYCSDCATGSCPDCDDCVAGCVPHECPSEAAVVCRMARPDCGDGNVAVARMEDGARSSCWVCVNRTTCEDVSRPGS